MISSILHYSTIDKKFLEINLKQLSKFSSEIIIPICTHLFNGEPEQLDESLSIISKFDKAKVEIFEWNGLKDNAGYYHNLSRKLGTDKSSNEWLFFVDTDEIVDDSFIPWVNSAIQNDYAYWLTSYWYFREPIFQAKQHEAQGLLIKKEKCNWNLDVRTEREQAFGFTHVINGNHQLILSNEGKPMLHHFSWVRTKEEMIKKIKNWGHHADKDWISSIEEEFSRPFNGTDFVHGYQYNQVNNIFNL